MSTVLPIPDFYFSSNAENSDYVVYPNALQVDAIRWKERFNIDYSYSDKERVRLIVIDQQYDFSYKEGSLFVGGRSGNGAIEDQDRLSKFIYSNLNRITEITCTMDSHLPYQVFFPVAHVREDGSHPEPFTVITSDDYKKGAYRANPIMAAQLYTDGNWLSKQFEYYCAKLENDGKYALTVWPYHCLIGSRGHCLSGVVDEARLFHSFVRGSKNLPILKGHLPLTEFYSVIRPEVRTTFDGFEIGYSYTNQYMLHILDSADKLIFAGEAASHCVLSTVLDYFNYAKEANPAFLKKMYILRDCMSSVVIPEVVDYTDNTEKVFAELQDAGVNVVDSATPITDWP